MHSWSVTYRKQDDAWSAVTSCYFDIFIDSVYFILIVFTSSRSSTSHCSSFPTKPRQHGKRIHAKTVISLLWCLVSYGNTKSGSFFYNSLWVRVFIDAKVISLFSLFVWSEGDGWAAALSCLSPLLALRTHEVAGICYDLPPFPPDPCC